MKAKDDERKEPLSKKTKTVRTLYIICCIVFCFVIARALLYTVSCLPQYGNPDNPANNEVALEGIVMGTTGKELYVTNSEELKAKASTKSGNTKLNELAKEIKESYGYIWIDLPKAVKLVPVNSGNEGYLTMARMLTGLTKDLVMKLTSPLEFKVELRVNSEDNFLKFFIDFKSFINSNSHILRNHFCNFVSCRIRKIHYSCYISNTESRL